MQAEKYLNGLIHMLFLVETDLVREQNPNRGNSFKTQGYK